MARVLSSLGLVPNGSVPQISAFAAQGAQGGRTAVIRSKTVVLNLIEENGPEGDEPGPAYRWR